MTATDANLCARMVRTHARTFALASRFLPSERRRAAYAVYAFCREADDLVDLAEGCPAPVVTARLAAYGAALERALAGRPEGPVFRELARAVAAHAIPHRVLRELLAGIARDVTPTRYASWDDLGLYCEGVASTVGEMCTHVFGVAGGAEVRERALRYARTLGVAMQLTNILRDVGEDGRRGRCYLPADELAGVSLAPDDVLGAARDARRGAALAGDPRWRELMRFQVARARALYAAAWPGIFLLAPEARRCAAACAVGYAAILDAIEARAYDSFAERARVGVPARAALLWSAWRATRPGCAVPEVGDGPSVAWAHDAPGPAPLTHLPASA